jgi:hypothetical protein
MTLLSIDERMPIFASQPTTRTWRAVANLADEKLLDGHHLGHLRS